MLAFHFTSRNRRAWTSFAKALVNPQQQRSISFSRALLRDDGKGKFAWKKGGGGSRPPPPPPPPSSSSSSSFFGFGKKSSKTPEGYARTFLDWVQPKNLPIVYREMEIILAAFKDLPQSVKKIEDPVEFFQVALSRLKFSPSTVAFVSALVKDAGMDIVVPTVQAVLALKDSAKPVTVKFTSAKPISEGMKPKFKEVVESFFFKNDNTPRNFVWEVDPGIMGGFRILVGEKLVDRTLSSSFDAIMKAFKTTLDSERKPSLQYIQQIRVPKVPAVFQ